RLRLVEKRKPRSQEKSRLVIGRMLSAHSVPAFRISAPLVAALMNPVLAATGKVRMTSLDVRRYQVKLRSATSLKSPPNPFWDAVRLSPHPSPKVPPLRKVNTVR